MVMSNLDKIDPAVVAKIADDTLMAALRQMPDPVPPAGQVTMAAGIALALNTVCKIQGLDLADVHQLVDHVWADIEEGEEEP